MYMYGPHKIDALHQYFFNLIRNGIALIDTDGTIHKYGKVNHEVLPKTMCLDRIDRLYSGNFACQFTNLFIQYLPGKRIHQIIR